MEFQSTEKDMSNTRRSSRPMKPSGRPAMAAVFLDHMNRPDLNEVLLTVDEYLSGVSPCTLFL